MPSHLGPRSLRPPRHTQTFPWNRLFMSWQRQADLSRDEVVPGGQSLQGVLDMSLLNFPAAHVLHEDHSNHIFSLYAAGFVSSTPLPAGHAQRLTSSTPSALKVKKEVSHGRQCSVLLPPTQIENLPPSQSVHAALPSADLYLPTAHGEHSELLDCVYPTMHEKCTLLAGLLAAVGSG